MTTTSAFYANCDENSSEARAHKQRRHSEYFTWKATYRSYLESKEESELRDWEEFGAQLASGIGETPNFIAAKLRTFDVLSRLPKFRGLVEELMHLSMYLLQAIADYTNNIHPENYEDPDIWAQLDAELTRYLTPKKRRQALPSRKSIIRRLGQIITAIQGHLAPSSSTPEARPPSYHTYPTAPGSSHIGASLPDEKAQLIDTTIRNYASAHSTTLPEAFSALILENAEVKVTLNVYQAADIPNAPIMLADGRVIEDENWIKGQITSVRDIDLSATLTSQGYQPSAALAAFLAGRDGTCRFFGCDKPAEECDSDHRINYADGGPTHAFNLVKLCRGHHNVKTDQSIKYFFDPFTADVYWLFADGTWILTEANGPLAPVNRRWVRSLENIWKAQHAKAWETDTPPKTQGESTDSAQGDPKMEQHPPTEGEEPPF